jgi:hypothetical protein
MDHETRGWTWAVGRGLSGSSQGRATWCTASTTNLAAPIGNLQNVRDKNVDQKWELWKQYQEANPYTKKGGGGTVAIGREREQRTIDNARIQYQSSYSSIATAWVCWCSVSQFRVPFRLRWSRSFHWHVTRLRIVARVLTPSAALSKADVSWLSSTKHTTKKNLCICRMFIGMLHSALGN